MKNIKLDGTKILGICGIVLSAAAAMVGRVNDKKQLEITVANEVQKALENQQ